MVQAREQTMSLTIELSPQTEKRLAERAAEAGKTVELLAREILEKDVAKEKTLDEILAPFRQSFAESGMSEEDLDALVEAAREEIWQEKHGTPSRP
jgi:plasmid stability protein